MQFTRLSNCYFLMTVIILMFKGVSPVPAYTNVMPLSFVLLCSLAREAFEDIKRWLADNVTNKQVCRVLRPKTQIAPEFELELDHFRGYEK
mmetsp:Transcript_25517/g.19277  ORF Transcript_25517/g.19277 Transcript_25517/m.19277 type:complete len:91 (-) Transcript_25517:3581-3853(-)